MYPMREISPQDPCTTTAYEAESTLAAALMESVGDCDPETVPPSESGTLLRYHWYPSAALTTIESDAGWPSATVKFCGACTTTVPPRFAPSNRHVSFRTAPTVVPPPD